MARMGLIVSVPETTPCGAIRFRSLWTVYEQSDLVGRKRKGRTFSPLDKLLAMSFTALGCKVDPLLRSVTAT
jgi:hypothetical protein